MLKLRLVFSFLSVATSANRADPVISPVSAEGIGRRGGGRDEVEGEGGGGDGVREVGAGWGGKRLV